MHDVTDIQPPLDRLGIALRYLFAATPLLLYGLMLTLLAGNDAVPRGVLLALPFDMLLGVAALVLMWWRRRWPRVIALLTGALTTVSFSALGAAVVSYLSLCTHRSARWIALTAVFLWGCLTLSGAWQGRLGFVLVYAAMAGVAVGTLTVLGLYLRERRELAAARRAADLAAQARRVEQAQLAERLKIAQEMHDVLAHRISLLAMLAGGLSHRTDLTAEQNRDTALAIQENAHQSLNELRAVLGSLRRDGPQAPQPTLGELEALFEEVRAAGQRVDATNAIDGSEGLPERTGRHVYRIVQEALTNARKHAPGSRVCAELAGRAGEGVRIKVSNPASPGVRGPGAGLGLVGLAERTRLAGGGISHGIRDGRFVLDAWLPWDAH
ncbi:sensor histidine kinase [Nonomuraea jiangxiensis]|uniref:histidine kinase n=1 Tax=Nonomuraea jiangxiensis TaxID=633440 RepID=A0A1G9J044_9ACTN|nr:histidine kinase [Nonomuraea jiangxiensis]SDL30867.1 Signal transduction histidine kinase [Nonomuraea jiangxiensis]